MKINGEKVAGFDYVPQPKRQAYFDDHILPKILGNFEDFSFDNEIINYINHSKYKKMRVLGQLGNPNRKWIPVIEFDGHNWVHQNNIEQYGEEYGIS